ncbi:Cytochrome b-c1 complex subunit 7-2 [Striga hermonthica]|uniref:Cytochrome b-c1 complex subunit 7-2 n=1 Tax=Striga hermonthica TaxID=68872 RepID=A0A9N7MVB9_STRHE|nr:Cytochrome b-c1 complex subunit 7-2 [Striga hermonthica]
MDGGRQTTARSSCNSDKAARPMSPTAHVDEEDEKSIIRQENDKRRAKVCRLCQIKKWSLTEKRVPERFCQSFEYKIFIMASPIMKLVVDSNRKPLAALRTKTLSNRLKTCSAFSFRLRYDNMYNPMYNLDVKEGVESTS